MAAPSRSGRSSGGRRSGDGRSAAGGRRGQRGTGGVPTGSTRNAEGARSAKGRQNETVEQLAGPLQKVLARLPETQRKVLELRMGLADGHPHDLADTARALGLSLSEARDIEQRAFGYIREAVPLQQLQRFIPKS